MGTTTWPVRIGEASRVQLRPNPAVNSDVPVKVFVLVPVTWFRQATSIPKDLKG